MSNNFKNNSLEMKIGKVKVASMKKIFRNMGEEISPYAEILTEAELVKCFNFFSEVCASNIDSVVNVVWGEPSEKNINHVDNSIRSRVIEKAWKDFLSIETKDKLKNCKKILIPKLGG